MLPLLLALTAQADRGCAAVQLRDLLDAPSPSVLVLGESPANRRQLRRAARVARTLRDRGIPVTIALEVLPTALQSAIAEHRSPEPDLEHFRAMVRWQNRIDVPFDPYRPLLALGLSTVPRPVRLIAVGPPRVPTERPTAEAPAALVERLSDLAGPDLPYVARLPLAAARVASDTAIAETALGAWDQQGVLIVVADRTRVAGRGGLPDRLASATDLPVRAATLDWRDQDCVDGTWQWLEPTVRAALPSALFSRDDRP